MWEEDEFADDRRWLSRNPDAPYDFNPEPLLRYTPHQKEKTHATHAQKTRIHGTAAGDTGGLFNARAGSNDAGMAG